MDAEEFCRHGKEMIDYVADYLENIRERRVFPTVEPGYLRKLIPEEAPEEGESFEDIFKDVERVIMPGITHWQSPNFHAYFPTGSSYPAIVADILSGSFGGVGFSWASSPACTELEVVVLDWLAKMLELPESFLASSGGTGGGVIQGTASEATLVALLSARAREILRYKQTNGHSDDGVIMSKFVAYCSDQSHSSVEKAGLIACIRMRKLPTDADCSLRGQTLRDAINEDRAHGLIPIYVCATLGTTPSCAFDCVKELGVVCQEESIWMHIDAAYAGSAFICPEFRPLLEGVEFAESFNFNAHKWLKVNFDCSVMWVRNSNLITGPFNVESLYLKHQHQGAMPDYRHWQIPMGRRFRSLKLWFVLRTYGRKELQNYIRKDVSLAHLFEGMVVADGKFEIVQKVVLGLVSFRLKNASNATNERLLKAINADGRINMVPAEIRGVYFLRFVVCASRTTDSDVMFAWDVIRELTESILKDSDNK
ncbi:aromatic-L-amino-acid decarboxylase-like [Dreissena polymorpha]|uniref:aromatic-L-amino-acid decarboxylase-like n=1 Tax=Dreissena polymorpha TaxID=45954 RepID=UPI0022646D7A|nr:aromatic-L-amino-acid decarboxylase-like [Dreissena polymorpha]